MGGTYYQAACNFTEEEKLLSFFFFSSLTQMNQPTYSFYVYKEYIGII